MRLSFLLFFTFFSFHLSAQNYYWILLKDKTEKSFDPLSYFDAKAIERRIINELPLYDYTDLPVNENYIQQITKSCTKIYFASRWLNAVAVETASLN